MQTNKDAKLWKLCSEYNRRKDCKNGYVACCSCGKIYHWKEMDAGHFIPKGMGAKGKTLEFEENNIFAQCKKCNRNKNASRAYQEMVKVNYSAFMVRRFGAGIFDKLKALQRVLKLDVDRKIEYYQNKLKELE